MKKSFICIRSLLLPFMLISDVELVALALHSGADAVEPGSSFYDHPSTLSTGVYLSLTNSGKLYEVHRFTSHNTIAYCGLILAGCPC